MSADKKRFRVFIDGREGTTGLQIEDRLKQRPDVELLDIDPDKRKDVVERRRLLNAADVAFLCLPDKAAVEAAELMENQDTILIDASTAHRTSPGWAYGFAELSPAHRQAIAASKRIANPGCHASGVIAAAYPLVQAGLLPKDYPLSAHSITGYSGGGKKMIAQYEAADRDAALDSPRQYGLGLNHKHLPEIQAQLGLATPPVFNPIVCDFYAGMAVSLPLVASHLKGHPSKKQLEEIYAAHYQGAAFLRVEPAPQDGFLPANLLTGTNRMGIYVLGNDELMTVVCVFDNLGKGASGAAVQNMNIALGLPEDHYLQ